MLIVGRIIAAVFLVIIAIIVEVRHAKARAVAPRGAKAQLLGGPALVDGSRAAGVDRAAYDRAVARALRRVENMVNTAWLVLMVVFAALGPVFVVAAVVNGSWGDAVFATGWTVLVVLMLRWGLSRWRATRTRY